MVGQDYKFRKRMSLGLSLSLAALVPLGYFAPVRAEVRQPILEVRGALEQGDSVLDEDSSLYDVHSFQGRAGQSVTILLESTDFDTYVLIADAEGKVLDENDDISDRDSNSQITISLPRDGTYSVIVNGYEAKDRGKYTLIIN